MHDARIIAGTEEHRLMTDKLSTMEKQNAPASLLTEAENMLLKESIMLEA